MITITRFPVTCGSFRTPLTPHHGPPPRFDPHPSRPAGALCPGIGPANFPGPRCRAGRNARLLPRPGLGKLGPRAPHGANRPVGHAAHRAPRPTRLQTDGALPVCLPANGRRRAPRPRAVRAAFCPAAGRPLGRRHRWPGRNRSGPLSRRSRCLRLGYWLGCGRHSGPRGLPNHGTGHAQAAPQRGPGPGPRRRPRAFAGLARRPRRTNQRPTTTPLVVAGASAPLFSLLTLSERMLYPSCPPLHARRAPASHQRVAAR